MDSRDINQADICRELGVSSATVSDWCTGKKYPRVDAMQRLADLLGVRFSMLTAENGIKNYKDQQLLEALHQDPKLRMLFDRVLTMSKEDREKMFQISGIIKGELYGDD
jgi:transcriptional regulator with XRE-family HTH domain